METWVAEYVCYFASEFKIDLIVWKHCNIIIKIIMLEMFKIDLIVWKHQYDYNYTVLFNGLKLT